jgi:hypothetical protein
LEVAFILLVLRVAFPNVSRVDPPSAGFQSITIVPGLENEYLPVFSAWAGGGVFAVGFVLVYCTTPLGKK